MADRTAVGEGSEREATPGPVANRMRMDDGRSDSIEASAIPEWPLTPAGYERIGAIGHGTFATVYKARVLEAPHEGETVAIKIIELEQFPDSNLEEIRCELATMNGCAHPNVISYHVAFVSSSQLWLVMPFLSAGSCLSVMKNAAKAGLHVLGHDVGIIAYILKETAEALKYFHHNHVIHRDLKAGNILLGGDGSVYLADFGVSASLKEVKTRTTFVGTPCWMAPEVLEQCTGYDNKADVWSFGITAVELAKGEAPFQRFAPLKVMMMILQQQNHAGLSEEEQWDQDLVALVNDCLQRDPKLRPSIDDVLQKHSALFNKATKGALVNLIEQLPLLETRTSPRNSARISIASEPRYSVGAWDFGNGEESGRSPSTDPLASLGDSEA